MGGMLGSYTAAVTAFTVNVVGLTAIRTLGLPAAWFWIFWVVPPAIGIAGMLVWQRAYRRKFRRGTRPAELATVRIRTAGAD